MISQPISIQILETWATVADPQGAKISTQRPVPVILEGNF